MCIVGCLERRVMAGREFWCLKAAEGHRIFGMIVPAAFIEYT